MQVIRKYAIAALLLISGSAHAQMIQGGVEGTICNAQGAPHYCAARTDFTFVPLPSPLPSVGGSSGAGNCISQPGYANEVCRATDINSQTGSTGVANKQQFGPCCGGAADYPEWNADSTLFWVSNNGGQALLYQLNDSVDPPQIHCVQSGPMWSVGTATNCIAVSTWIGGASAPNSGMQWDAVNPLVFYAVENSTQMWKFTMPSVTPGTPTATQLFDLAVAPNCGNLTGSAIGPFRISTDGQNFMMIFSPNGQDEQYRAVYYNLTQGCRWIDTLTWQVGGNWGPTGAAAFNFTNSVTNSQISSGIATVTLNINPTSLPMFINGAAVPTCTITGATNATPIVLTLSPSCTLDGAGQIIGVTGVIGNTAANGTWVAPSGGTSITLMHLDGTNSVGNGAYVSGGTLYHGPLITVSGSTHCPACNLTTAEVTAVSSASKTVSYIDKQPM